MGEDVGYIGVQKATERTRKSGDSHRSRWQKCLAA